MVARTVRDRKAASSVSPLRPDRKHGQFARAFLSQEVARQKQTLTRLAVQQSLFRRAHFRRQGARLTSLATPTRQKARTICPCFLVSRSGSTETNTDAIGRATIAIPPRAFPKARRAAYKSRHSDQETMRVQSHSHFYIQSQPLRSKNG